MHKFLPLILLACTHLPAPSPTLGATEQHSRQMLFEQVSILGQTLSYASNQRVECWVGFGDLQEGRSHEAIADCRFVSTGEFSPQLVLLFSRTEEEWQIKQAFH